MPPYDYSDLPGLQGADNDPGLEQTVYIAPLSDFDVIADPIDPPVNPGDTLRITADHTFQATKGWLQLYTTLDTAKLVSEAIGERDGRGHNPKLDFFHPGGSEAAAEFAYAAKNDAFLILVTTQNGKIIQIGRAGMGADIVGSFNSGTVSSERNGWTFTCETFGKLFYYEGLITLKP